MSIDTAFCCKKKFVKIAKGLKLTYGGFKFLLKLCKNFETLAIFLEQHIQLILQLLEILVVKIFGLFIYVNFYFMVLIVQECSFVTNVLQPTVKVTTRTMTR